MPMIADSLRSISAALIVATIIIMALVLGKGILVPFALAMLLTFVLQPIVSRLSRTGMPEGASAAIVVGLAVSLVVGAAVLFSSQILSLAGDLAANRHNIAMKMRTIAGVSSSSDSVFKRAADSVDVLSRDIKREIEGPMTAPAAGDPGKAVVVAPATEGARKFDFAYVESFIAPFASAGLVLLFTLFLLMQHHDLRDRVVRVAGTDHMSVTSAALSEAAVRLSDIFTTQALLNGAFGLFVTIALWGIGVPHALLWGAATALLRFVPFVGAFLAAVPPVIVAAAIDPGWSMVIATAAVFVVGEPIMGHVIEPQVLGKRAGLSPLAFLFAASFWTLIWGPIGLILAAPLTMSLVVFGQYVPRFEFLTVLLGDEPALAPDQEFYHRMLSADSYAAYEQFEDAVAAQSVTAASDDVVIPALRIAARDQRSGRIEADQVTTLSKSMRDFLDLTAERDDGAARRSTKGNAVARPVVILAERGPIDEIAAQFIADLARSRLERPVVLIENESGLMGLASVQAVLNGGAPDDLVLITVGGLGRGFSKLIRKRALRDFPAARVISCELYGDTATVGFEDDVSGDRQYRCRSVQQLLAVLEANTSKADEVARTDPVRMPAETIRSPEVGIA